MTPTGRFGTTHQCISVHTRVCIVTRFDDVRRVLTDTDHFTYRLASLAGATEPAPRQRGVNDLFEKEGWLPAPTLAGRDDPNHKEMRAMFNRAFSPKRVKELDSEVHDLAYRLIDDFIDEGRCDWASQFSVPLQLLTIGWQMGANPEDIWKIKEWTEAFFHRISMMLDEEEEMATVRKEIDAQHYFQPIFERLRERPDDTLLSARQYGDRGMGSTAQ